MPVNMMPEAARERTVSVRARAPHSLRLQEYPRPKASFTERDSMVIFVPEIRTYVNKNVTRVLSPGARGVQRRQRQSVQTETRRPCLSLKWPTMMTMKSTKVQMPKPPRVNIWMMPVMILPT